MHGAESAGAPCGNLFLSERRRSLLKPFNFPRLQILSAGVPDGAFDLRQDGNNFMAPVATVVLLTITVTASDVRSMFGDELARVRSHKIGRLE